MTIKEDHKYTLWLQELQEIVRARHKEPSIHRPSLGARIRARGKQKVANNPYMPQRDPGLRQGTSREVRGYGPSNMVLLQLASYGVKGVMPTEHGEWPERFER